MLSIDGVVSVRAEQYTRINLTSFTQYSSTVTCNLIPGETDYMELCSVTLRPTADIHRVTKHS